MSLFDKDDVISIVEQDIQDNFEVLEYGLSNFSELLIGHLGEHLNLDVKISVKKSHRDLRYFVKCLPRFDEEKKKYIESLNFFRKEYEILCLLRSFGGEEKPKWRSKVYLLKPKLLVLEHLIDLGYTMPRQELFLSPEEVKACLRSVATFHAGTFIYEEKESKRLGRKYSLYEDYGDFLQEPEGAKVWRDYGKQLVKDLLVNFSNFKEMEQFGAVVDETVDRLYTEVMVIMKPNKKWRNAIVHRDLWSNNILLKPNEPYALLIDFQTVLYAPPMTDVASLLYMNTSKELRDKHLDEFIETYYTTLEECLSSEGVNIETVIAREAIKDAYNEGLLFGITQSALILPLVAAGSKENSDLLPEFKDINSPKRSREIVSYARDNKGYRKRLMDVCDEMVERYIVNKDI